ncbi:phosphoribulokinase [Mycobacterium sp. 050128]|uniref:phosphoribulokinase n=1 Tax=Mycobacterium sp. 050128 TaxID=3096112 RepID=UPI002ED8C24D
MPEKSFRIGRASGERHRPVMLAVAGDSGAGKTTVTSGVVEALGRDRCVSISTDDYQRFDREERRDKPFTSLHPDCSYVAILEQHLQLLATGQPVLKPVYEHSTGRRMRPALVEPNDFIIVHGVLPLHSKLARACFDVAVFLDTPEDVRRDWKMKRDTALWGCCPDQVTAEIEASQAEYVQFIEPQRAHADIVVGFAPIPSRADPPETPLSVEVLLRPTIRQPDLTDILRPDLTHTAHLRLGRDTDGRPVDSLHIHGYATPEENAAAEKIFWHALGDPSTDVPACLGLISPGVRSTPLAMTQILLLHHVIHGPR